ncbi:MAG: hypothetical protein ACR2OA_18630, partial [Rubripirellula sp.]
MGCTKEGPVKRLWLGTGSEDQGRKNRAARTRRIVTVGIQNHAVMAVRMDLSDPVARWISDPV